MAKHIKIKTVHGTSSDGEDLKNYYFEESGEGYNFYAPGGGKPLNGTQLITPENRSFRCSIPIAGPPPETREFAITVASFPMMEMHGSWSDEDRLLAEPGSGTFQAQASTTGPVPEEEAHAASAK